MFWGASHKPRNVIGFHVLWLRKFTYIWRTREFTEIFVPKLPTTETHVIYDTNCVLGYEQVEFALYFTLFSVCPKSEGKMMRQALTLFTIDSRIFGVLEASWLGGRNRSIVRGCTSKSALCKFSDFTPRLHIHGAKSDLLLLLETQDFE